MKRTQWFDANTKPVHVGVYETTLYGMAPLYQHWNGKRWGWEAENPRSAALLADMKASAQHLEWRGLVEQATE